MVSDCWKGTIAAVKALRKENGWGTRTLRHELVNHSAGEIVNPRGFTTNAIEGRWSVLKRWLKKRNGGRMPTGLSRKQWEILLGEFQYRKFASQGNTMDSGHTFLVSPLHFFKVLAKQRKIE